MTEQRLRRAALLALLVLVFSGLLVAVLTFQFPPAVGVTVKNTGTAPVMAVYLRVSGRAYDLGDIAPGESSTAQVSPASESSLKVVLREADGQRRHLKVDSYLEPGYRGTLLVTIKAGQIETVEDRTTLAWW